MQLYYISLFILVLALTGASAKQENCDPFYFLNSSTQRTCAKSSIFYIYSPFNIEINAFLPENCVKERTTVSLVYTHKETGVPVVRREHPNEEYYFEYSISWDEERSNCIVDLVPDDVPKNADWMMIDQNGIPNTPFETLGELAHHKTYTRRFILDANSPTNFRLAYTCARVPNSNKPEQRAMVYGISFGPVNKSHGPKIILFKPSTRDYDCWKHTPQCHFTAPHEDAKCVWVPTDLEPIAMWYYKGGWYSEDIPDIVSIPGNLHVDIIQSSAGVSGCIKPWHKDEITIGLRPDIPVNLQQAEQCKTPLYEIEPREKPYGILARPRKDCKYLFKPDLIQKTTKGTNGSLSLLAPKSAWSLDCEKPKNLEDVVQDETKNRQNTNDPENKPSNSLTHMTLVILLALGVAGVAWYKRNQRNQPRILLFKPLV